MQLFYFRLFLDCVEPNDEKNVIKLPVSIGISSSKTKITIRPSKMLYFNRVAKTGSQSFTHLLVTLGPKLGFRVTPKIRQTETLADDEEGLAEEVDSTFRVTKPMVFVRHYSFIDFERRGLGWKPDWFNIVREPIDKVREKSLKQKIWG